MHTYRTDRSYGWNYAHGPLWDGPLPRVPATPMKRFLGLPVRSRLGIAAGLLLNSRWIGLYSRLGYDILTYKTVRSRARRSHPLPNWVTVDAPGPLGRARHARPGRFRSFQGAPEALTEAQSSLYADFAADRATRAAGANDLAYTGEWLPRPGGVRPVARS